MRKESNATASGERQATKAGTRASEPAGGEAAALSSRDLRKRHSLLDTGRGTTWWAPGAVGWWIGVLFAVGASFFAVGAAPGYVRSVGNGMDALTFFIGSLFFTTAAFLQYLETANPRLAAQGGSAGGRIKFFTWQPKRLEWWTPLVQLAGTLYFNVSTFQAMRANLSIPQVDHLVWKPDALGSACFMVASALAWLELSRPFWTWRPRGLSSWIVALNMLGSIAFEVSAVASYVVVTTGHHVSATLVNLGTFVGALCFFAAAVMLLPERTGG